MSWTETVDFDLTEKQQRRVQQLKHDLQVEMARQRWNDTKDNAIDALCFLREIGVPRELLLPVAKRLHHLSP